MQRINAEFIHEAFWREQEHHNDTFIHSLSTTTLALKCPMFWCRTTFMTIQTSLRQCQLIFLRIFRNTESTDPFLLVAHHRHSFLAFDPFRYVCLGSRATSVCNNLFRNQWSAGRTRSTLDYLIRTRVQQRGSESHFIQTQRRPWFEIVICTLGQFACTCQSKSVMSKQVPPSVFDKLLLPLRELETVTRSMHTLPHATCSHSVRLNASKKRS